MDSRRGQIRPRLGQLQAPLDPRLLPCSADPQIGVEFPAALPDESREEGGEKPLLQDLPGQRRQERPLPVEGGRKARRDRQLETPPGLSLLRQRQGNGRREAPLPASPTRRKRSAGSTLISPSGLNQRTFPPERAASPFRASLCPGRRFPAARPARRPSRLIARGSQGRKSARSIPVHSRRHVPLSGDRQACGRGGGEGPFSIPPPARASSIPACRPRSFPSRLSDPCSTPIRRPSTVRTPEAPIRPATTSRPAPISAAEAGSAPCQPHESSAVRRSASSASRSFCQRILPRGSAILPVRSSRSPERIFPATRPVRLPIEADVTGQPAAEAAPGRCRSIPPSLRAASGIARRAGAGEERVPFSDLPRRPGGTPARRAGLGRLRRG